MSQNLTFSKKVPYQKNTLSKNHIKNLKKKCLIKEPDQESEKGALESKQNTLSKKPYQESKKKASYEKSKQNTLS